MHILVTNDDGVMAPGLLALAQEMRRIGNGEHPGAGSQLVWRWACEDAGSPAAHPRGSARRWQPGAGQRRRAVGLRGAGAAGLLPGEDRPGGLRHQPDGESRPRCDLLRHGDRSHGGGDLAARRRWLSRWTRENHLGALDYAPAAHIARKIVQTVLPAPPAGWHPAQREHPVPSARTDQGYNITRQGMRVYRDRLDQRVDHAAGRISGSAATRPPAWRKKAPTSARWPRVMYRSLRLQLDLTAYPALHQLGAWKWEDIEDRPEAAVWHEQYYEVSTTNR